MISGETPTLCVVKTGFEQHNDSTMDTPKFSPCDDRTIPSEHNIEPHFMRLKSKNIQKQDLFIFSCCLNENYFQNVLSILESNSKGNLENDYDTSTVKIISVKRKILRMLEIIEQDIPFFNENDFNDERSKIIKQIINEYSS